MAYNDSVPILITEKFYYIFQWFHNYQISGGNDKTGKYLWTKHDDDRARMLSIFTSTNSNLTLG